MEILLKRQRDTGKETVGTLFIFKDDLSFWSCKTLERPWKANQIGISCIPKGQYKVKMTYSPKFDKMTYELQQVPNRSAIRIHSGNYFTDIEGCILLGDAFKDINKDGEIDVLNSILTVKKFEEMIGNKDFLLSII